MDKYSIEFKIEGLNKEAYDKIMDTLIETKIGKVTILSSTSPVEEKGLPEYCKDNKRGKDDVCKYPMESCEQCKNLF